MSSPLHDVQLGGFGMFFFEATVLLLLLFVITKRKEHWWWAVLIVLLFLFVSLLILPSGFIARYVPFFYIFPFVIIVYLLRNIPNGVIRKVTHLATGLLSLSIIINILGVAMLVGVLRTQLDYVVNEISNKSKEVPVFVNTASCLNYDKMEQAGAQLYFEDMEGNLKTTLDMFGVDINTSMRPSDFREKTKPGIMKKVPMFDLQITTKEQ